MAQQKITLANDSDEFNQTFIIHDENHTMANALRWMLMKNPQVLFCGYSIPHPSENIVHVRIQSQQVTAAECLDAGLDSLKEMLGHVKSSFEQAYAASQVGQHSH